MLYTEDDITPLDTVVERLLWVKGKILAFPERYDQGEFAPRYIDCGTVGCIAGWLDLHVYGEKVHFNGEGGVAERASRALGLKTPRCPQLFAAALVNAAGEDKHARAELAGEKIDEYIAKITGEAVARMARRL